MARSKRIDYLASLLEGYDTVLDIGSDHGYVLEKAFKNGYIKQGIATDVRIMPLQRSMETLKNYPVRGILSDGFLAVDQPFDACVIAGMGAYLISDMLSFAPFNEAIYILQPNDKEAYLRQKLCDLGFEIIDEHIVDDRFYYVIIIVKRGQMTLSKEDLILGPKLKNKIEAKAYYIRRIKVMKDIMDQADEAKKLNMQEEYQIMLNRINVI